MDYKQILYAVEDGVAVVTLNRPEKLNAMTAQMGAEMDDAMAEADEDDEVRAVVVTGAGRGFCAGADLGSGGRFAAGWGEAEPGLRRKLPMDVRKPVIAAINGPAVGAGLTWPLQTDIRYVAEDAKLAFAFVRRGVLPELASHVILARLCGLSKAAELLMSGRTFSGREAVEYGVAPKPSRPIKCWPSRWPWPATSPPMPPLCRWPFRRSCCGRGSAWTSASCVAGKVDC